MKQNNLSWENCIQMLAQDKNPYLLITKNCLKSYSGFLSKNNWLYTVRFYLFILSDRLTINKLFCSKIMDFGCAFDDDLFGDEKKTKNYDQQKESYVPKNCTEKVRTDEKSKTNCCYGFFGFFSILVTKLG